jgi:hypothetical protein
MSRNLVEKRPAKVVKRRLVRTIASGILLFAFVAACAEDQPQVSLPPQEPSPTQSLFEVVDERAILKQEVTNEAALMKWLSAQVAIPTSHLSMHVVAKYDQTTFFMAAIDRGRSESELFGWAVLGANGDAHGDVIENTRNLEEPSEGSGSTSYVRVDSPGQSAFVGRADPTLSKLISIDASGRLLAKARIGAAGFILPVRDWIQVRTFRGPQLVGAAPVVPPDVVRSFVPAERGDIELAEAFTRSLLVDPQTAMDHVIPLSARNLIPPLEQSLGELGNPTVVGIKLVDEKVLVTLKTEAGKAEFLMYFSVQGNRRGISLYALNAQ